MGFALYLPGGLGKGDVTVVVVQVQGKSWFVSGCGRVSWVGPLAVSLVVFFFFFNV